MDTKFINQSERYGEQDETTIGDYQELNPAGEFEIRQGTDGDLVIVEKKESGEVEIVAVAK
jgi:hypothetical protein